MPILPGGPNISIIDMFAALILAGITAKNIFGINLNIIDYILFGLACFWVGLRGYFRISNWWKSRDTHEKRSTQ